MPESIICVESLSKSYWVGHRTTTSPQYATFRDTVARNLKRLQRMSLDLARGRQIIQGDEVEEFWALRDVSFEVAPGEVVGIIGRNGAGKSTLLKILSRITEPTRGRVTLRGRVASLLEVGTGFHPELSGRENIFLNGAILGMSRREIEKKFDEIVAFAEVENFIDTPVKRYSSGMYVRLAFAVAAHLDPEILVVDEVLAVGDHAFQKKCLGKMKSVASEGRTILFVSHNLQAIATLTSKTAVLSAGKIEYFGTTRNAIAEYSETVFGADCIGRPYQVDAPKQTPHICRATVETTEPGIHICGEEIAFTFEIENQTHCEGLRFSFQVCDESGRPVCHFWLLGEHSRPIWSPGTHHLKCKITEFNLYMGKYTLTTWLNDRRSDTLLEQLTDICPFEVSMGQHQREEYPWHPGDMVFRVEGNWDVDSKQVESA